MELQIALDTFDPDSAVSLIDDISRSVGIVEIGTPMILSYGMVPVRMMVQKHPEQIVLADTKIMDAGEFEASAAFEAGARIATVMGVTHDATIEGTVTAARKYHGKIMADMMCVENLEDRAKRLVQLGVDYICVHSAVDVQRTESPFDSLKRIQSVIACEHCAIAGGINLNSIEQLIPYRPGIVIVGNGITGQADRKAAAAAIQRKLKGSQQEWTQI